MENRTKKRYIVGAGLLAGFALGYYLNSKEGRAWRQKTMSQLDEYGEEISGIGRELGTLAGNYADEAKNRGQALVDDARQRGENLADQAKQTVANGKEWMGEKKDAATDALAEVESSFKRGANKAKAKVSSITKS